MKELFRIALHKDVKVVSLGLFNVLLLRTVSCVEEIYEKTGSRALELGCIETYISPREYCKIRVHIEALTRKHLQIARLSTEPKIRDIYANMPVFLKDKNTCMQLELEVERRCSYLNPEILEFIRDLRKADKIVVLACDTYLTKDLVEDLLVSAGMDIALFDRIYVSCEENASKGAGSLFAKMIKDYALNQAELLNVGDDLNGDILKPRKMGIQTHFYNVVDDLGCSSMIAERLIMGDLCPELYALRKYVYAHHAHLEEHGRFWLGFGSAVMGPVLTLFADWVIDQARESGIKTIYTLMREGALLEPMLSRAANKKGYPCEIKSLYVSRLVFLFAGCDRVNEGAVRRVILRRGMTLRRIFELFGLEEYGYRFEPFYDLEYLQYKDLPTESGTVYKDLVSYLLSDEIAQVIGAFITDANDRCTAYLKQECTARDYLTVDIGYSATAQRGMNRFLRNGTGLYRHLLLFASDNPTLQANVFADPQHPGTLDIRGYFDTYGKYSDYISAIYTRNRPLELLMMDERGSTVGYESDGAVLKPILKNMPSMTPHQLRHIALCQQGVLAFQDAYFSMPDDVKPSQNDGCRKQLLKILYRVLCHPTYEEARYLGNMQFDENNGADYVSYICDESEIRDVRLKGLDALIKTKTRRNVLWPEGLLAQTNRDFSTNHALTAKSDLDEQIWILVREVVRSGVTDVVVCGTGTAGRQIAAYLKICGIRVEAFADNNARVHGMVIDGIQAGPISGLYGAKNFVISSFEHKTALTKQIQDLKGLDTGIYTF
jgi:FMN phosphatase YigB (HAD superfamily)